MKREIEKTLLEWKNSYGRKPLLIRGARQVGKTYSVRKFSEQFEIYLEINFEEDPNVAKLFEGTLTPSSLCENLSAYYNQDIIPGKTLLFFDEIQTCPKAISSLRFFYEKMPELHLIATGSLLEFALEKIPSMGVGRIKSIYMFPLSFKEFLIASKEKLLLSRITDNPLNTPFDSLLHQKSIDLYKTFQIIGGLPEVVDRYIHTRSIPQCLEILDDLINTFKDDFAKYKERVDIFRISEVFNSIPLQSGEKFKYSKIDSSSSSTALKNSLELLEKAGLIYKIRHSASNGIPLGAEVKNKKFKVILFDTGIHQRILGLDISNYISASSFDVVNRGAIAEVFTGLEIMKYNNYNRKNSLYYWHREAKSSNAEIDYVVQIGEEIIPVEVKSGKSGTLKSLHSFVNSHHPPFSLKCSLANFGTDKNILSLPLYAISKLLTPELAKMTKINQPSE